MTRLADPSGRRDLLVQIYREAVAACRPDRLLEGSAWTNGLHRTVGAYERVALVAVGKAALPFVAGVERTLGRRLDTALAVVPHGYRTTMPADVALPSWTNVMEAGHPVPDEAGVAASEAVLRLADTMGPDDLLVVAVSGGGSALLPAPPPGVPLRDVRILHEALIRSGAPIDRVNTVRRCLSRVAGGRLAAAAAPAEVMGLVLSDVPGEDLATVASGPVSPRPSAAVDALSVLEDYAVEAPPAIQEVLVAGGLAPAVESAPTVIRVGGNRELVRAAADAARSRGLEPVSDESALVGEARTAGVGLVHRAMEARWGGPAVLIRGGETTVRVRGSGRGGRNQEIALAAAIAMAESANTRRGLTVLAAGSDGIDGPTEAAGAVCDGGSVEPGAAGMRTARKALEENDSNGYFRRAGGLVVTGPTHTNVMDLALVLLP